MLSHRPLIRTIAVATCPSRKLLEACAAFGIGLHHAPGADTAPSLHSAALDLHQRARPGSLSLLTGASGAGKSTLLSTLALIAGRDAHHVLTPPLPRADTPLIDLIDLPLAPTLRMLACVGLADATMLSRTHRQLSDGERFRLGLALALIEAQRCPHAPITLLIDEFAAVLDRTGARCLCVALRRWLANTPRTTPNLRIIAATSHVDVRPWLDPDLTITFTAPGVTHTIEAAP